MPPLIAPFVPIFNVIIIRLAFSSYLFWLFSNSAHRDLLEKNPVDSSWNFSLWLCCRCYCCFHHCLRIRMIKSSFSHNMHILCVHGKSLCWLQSFFLVCDCVKVKILLFKRLYLKCIWDVVQSCVWVKKTEIWIRSGKCCSDTDQPHDGTRNT